MRASREINEEISGRLYDILDIHLSPVYDDPWMRVSCRRMHLEWTIKSPAEKNNHTPNPDKSCRDIYDGLLPLPFEKLKLVANIYAPDHDGAQLLLLWQKLRALVAILDQAPGSKSVEIVLRQNGEHTWYWVSKVTTGLTTRLADSDLLLVLFGKLARVRHFSMTPYTLVMLQCNVLDALISDIDFFFDTELDALRGRAAAMLRLNASPRGSPVRGGSCPTKTKPWSQSDDTTVTWLHTTLNSPNSDSGTTASTQRSSAPSAKTYTIPSTTTSVGKSGSRPARRVSHDYRKSGSAKREGRLTDDCSYDSIRQTISPIPGN